MKVISTTWRYIVIHACLLAAFTGGYAQGCSIEEEITIQAFETTDILLQIENLVNEDLGADQGICGLEIEFEHSQLENIRITLTSPAGQQITVIGPGTMASRLTDLISWSISFTSCANPPAPDPGFSGQWNNDQNWLSFNNYTGTYHPFSGCLEDFNTGSANGNWLLSIENLGAAEGALIYFELILCNDTGNDCNSCYLDVGEFEEEFGIYCENDSRLDDLASFLEVNYLTGTGQSFGYVLIQGDEILDFDMDLQEADQLGSGTFQICALAISDEDRVEAEASTDFPDLQNLIDNREICADISNDCFVLEILPANHILSIDTLFCDGDTIQIRDLNISESLDTVISVFDTLPGPSLDVICDSTIHIRANKVITNAVINTSTTEVNCGQPVFLNGAASNSSPIPLSSYRWETVGGVLVNDFGPIAEVSAGGIYTLYIDNGICSDSAEVVLSETSMLEMIVEIQSRQCAEDSFNVGFQIEPGMDSITVEGPPDLDFTPDGFTTLNEGEYIINSFLGDCTDSDTILLINDIEALELELSADTLDCLSGEVTLFTNTNVSNPELIYTGPQDIADNTINPLVDVPGVYIVELIDANDCRVSDTIEIIRNEELPLLQINSSSSAFDCNTLQITLVATTDEDPEAFEFVWTLPGGTTVNDPVIQVAMAGNYVIEVTDPVSGCTATDSILLQDSGNPLENVNLFAMQPDCGEDSGAIFINNLPNDTNYDIFVNNNLVAGPEILENVAPGTYFIEIISAEGCIFDTSVLINAVIPLNVDLGEDIAGSQGQQFDLNVNLSIPLDQLDTMIWSDPEILSCANCLNPNVTISGNQSLIITVSDENGCIASDMISISVIDEFELFVPNIFTPNGDGDNDIFTVYLSESVVRIFDVRIFDRWGNLLFFQPEITNGVNNLSWDGTFNGELVGSGVYIFMAKLLMPDNTETILIKDITLLR